MTLFEIDETFTVGQVTRSIGEAVKKVYRNEIWVQGQIRNLSRSARGHVYFDLVEPVPAGATSKASIAVTLFDSNRQVVNRVITRTGNSVRVDDGVEVRIRASLDWYAPRGQIQLNMTSIDPEFTLGRLSADREQLIADLRSNGSFDANRSTDLALVPLRVALITGAGSAAEADFVRQLDGCGYAFAVTTLTARVQGEFAAHEVAEAVEAAQHGDVDVIAIVRGGGARTDLAAFDSAAIAHAIAASTKPVICGIGHEVDQSVADLVAHASFKTPTACAQFLIERVVAFDFELAQRAERLAQQAVVRPYLHRAALAERARDLATRTNAAVAVATSRTESSATDLDRIAGRRIARARQRLAVRRSELGVASRQAITSAHARCERHVDELARRPIHRLGTAQRDLALRAAKLSASDPQHALRRGWTITTRADGTLVRSVHDLEHGDQILTRAADGTVTSTVDTTQPTASPSSITTNQHD